MRTKRKHDELFAVDWAEQQQSWEEFTRRLCMAEGCTRRHEYNYPVEPWMVNGYIFSFIELYCGYHMHIRKIVQKWQDQLEAR